MITKDTLRLQEIEHELDKTAPWEDPPFRTSRAKLEREKERIYARIEGRDPMCAVFGKLESGEKRYRDLNANDKKTYRMKKSVLRILKVIKKSKGPEWWERYK